MKSCVKQKRTQTQYILFDTTVTLMSKPGSIAQKENYSPILVNSRDAKY